MNEPLPVAVNRPNAAHLAAARPAGTASFRSRFRTIVDALRPKQWMKNLLVIAAPAAAGVLNEWAVVLRTFLALVALCLIASATYVVNDLVDAVADRRHPVKRSRPIASGSLSSRAALAIALALAVAGVSVSVALGTEFFLVVVAYLGITMGYTFWLKRVEVLDIGAVASCFVIRALAGAAAADVSISPWFLILTSSVALFVVAGKRAADRMALEQEGERRLAGNGSDYPMAYLRYVWMLSSGIAIAAYCLWAFAQPHVVHGVAWSEISIVPFGLGVLRYALVVERAGGGQPEEVLLHDRSLQLIALSWLAVYAIGVYL